MKNRYSILAIALLFSIGAFAQKDEFKTLKKIFEKNNISLKDVISYKEAVRLATPLVSASNEEDVVYLNFYKANIPFIEMGESMTKPENQGNPQSVLKFFTPEKIGEISKNIEAVFAYEKKSSKFLLTKDIQDDVVVLKPLLLTYALSLEGQKRFKDASAVLFAMYQMDKTDQENLYYAAEYAVSAKEYGVAYDYYKILKDLNFSGEKINYVAVSKINDKEEYFASKADRDRAVKIGTHITPKDAKEPSKRGGIYKNMALILISEGKVDQAKMAIQEARKVNPDDISLILSEADLYLKTNEIDKYADVVKEVIAKDPTNPDLFYNLGVVSYKNKESQKAEVYFLKAIELKADYSNAFYNLAAIRLDEGQVLLEQMNKLGTTAADNKKYDILKDKRVVLLKEAMQHLEKTTSLDKKSMDAKIVLLSVYKALEMKEKTKVLQAEMDK
jgi:tetratricopeptide (TPR) repeat protein